MIGICGCVVLAQVVSEKHHNVRWVVMKGNKAAGEHMKEEKERVGKAAFAGGIEGGPQ